MVSGVVMARETFGQMFARELAQVVGSDLGADIRKALGLDESEPDSSDGPLGAGAHTKTVLQAATVDIVTNTTTPASIQNTDSDRRYIMDIPGCVFEDTNTTNEFGPYVMDAATSSIGSNPSTASSTRPLVENSPMTTSTLPVSWGASSTFRSQPPSAWQRVWKSLEFLNFQTNKAASSTAGSCTVLYTKSASST